ncbi:unnamed protein product, partial [marine sediment metagenome]
MMIENKPLYNRDLAELEGWFIFCVCVAGKSAKAVLPIVSAFLEPCADTVTPKEYVQILLHEMRLLDEMKAHKIGKYNDLHKFFCDFSRLPIDLETANVDELETI